MSVLDEVMRDLQELRDRLERLENLERANQATDLTSDVTFNSLNLGSATGAAAGGLSASGKIAIAGSFTPTNELSLSGQAARKIWMERHATANTAGNALSVQAGGATSGATDKAGGNLILMAGQNTGTGRNYSTLQSSVPALATGTGDGTMIDRVIAAATLALANNTTTAVVNFTLASNTTVAGILVYGVQVFNGTDVQERQGLISFHCANKGGVFSANTAAEAAASGIATSGSLSVTWTITAANPAVLSINANSSLTPSAGYPRVVYTLFNLTEQAIAVQ